MSREFTPLKRKYKGGVTINIWDIFRNPEIQDEVIKNLKFRKKVRKTEK